jgi:hypothetical protein
VEDAARAVVFGDVEDGEGGGESGGGGHAVGLDINAGRAGLPAERGGFWRGLAEGGRKSWGGSLFTELTTPK